VTTEQGEKVWSLLGSNCRDASGRARVAILYFKLQMGNFLGCYARYWRVL